ASARACGCGSRSPRCCCSTTRRGCTTTVRRREPWRARRRRMRPRTRLRPRAISAAAFPRRPGPRHRRPLRALPPATRRRARAPPASDAAAAAASVPSAPGTEPAKSAAAAPRVHVRTDVLDLDLSTRGGTLARADLLAYPQVKGEATPVRLENEDDPLSLYLVQAGLTGPGDAPYPPHLATYVSELTDYTLDGRNELRVPLTWSEAGVTATKTFVFHRGQYRIEVQYEVHNGGSRPWTARPYAQILRNDPGTKRAMFDGESYAFHGPAIYDGTKYRKLDTTDTQDSHLSLEVRDGWLAALQHHFVSAIVPARGAPYRFTLGASGDQYLLTATGPEQTVAPDATAQFSE